jgi:hypothetical protein
MVSKSKREKKLLLKHICHILAQLSNDTLVYDFEFEKRKKNIAKHIYHMLVFNLAMVHLSLKRFVIAPCSIPRTPCHCDTRHPLSGAARVRPIGWFPAPDGRARKISRAQVDAGLGACWPWSMAHLTNQLRLTHAHNFQRTNKSNIC